MFELQKEGFQTQIGRRFGLVTDPKDGDTCHQGFRVSLTLFYLPERAESLLKYLNLLWGMSNKFFTAVKSRKGFSLGTTRRCSGTTLSDKSELIEGRSRKVMDFKYVSEKFLFLE